MKRLPALFLFAGLGLVCTGDGDVFKTKDDCFRRCRERFETCTSISVCTVYASFPANPSDGCGRVFTEQAVACELARQNCTSGCDSGSIYGLR